MLGFDSVKLRLEREHHLTFLEFNYMILQAYDFLELSRRNGCTLQMGGSDQWGNIINGVELGRRVDDVELFGLTTPLRSMFRLWTCRVSLQHCGPPGSRRPVGSAPAVVPGQTR